MNESNRNVRTLIVCFVISIMVLIPLRFVEVGQGMMDYSSTQVLGETVSATEVVLPNAKLEEKVLYEAPYNEMDARAVPVVVSGCIAESDSKTIINQLKNQIEVGQLSKAEIDQVVKQITEVSKKACSN